MLFNFGHYVTWIKYVILCKNLTKTSRTSIFISFRARWWTTLSEIHCCCCTPSIFVFLRLNWRLESPLNDISDHWRSRKGEKMNHSLNGTPMSKSWSVCRINCIHKLSLCVSFVMLKNQNVIIPNIRSNRILELTMTSCSAMITASSSSSSVPSSFNDLFSSLLN